MSWGKRTIRGIEYDLTHLDPAVIDIEAADGANSYRVLVAYGCHCFARELQHGDHTHYHIQDGRSVRVLCPTRTVQSKHLPKIIREAKHGLAFFSQNTKMLLVDELPGVHGPYTVFFTVRGSKQKSLDAVMFVYTAYVKEKLPPRLPAVPFRALVADASTGSATIKPTRTTPWKKK